MMDNNSDIVLNSIENVPTGNASALFTVDSAAVFREDTDVAPRTLVDDDKYMPWGNDNLMPFDILNLIEKDETISTCQIFNAELNYGAGLCYDVCKATPQVADEVDRFVSSNDIPAYFLGVSQDIKHFAFAVSLIILNSSGDKIVAIRRKEAMYCRFAPADEFGVINHLYFANWRKYQTPQSFEKIALLDFYNPMLDLTERMKRGDKERKFAVVSRIPTVDSTYYPIPHYASIFKSKWYNIKQHIATAKEAKLRNSAPIKYHINISAKYWENIWRREGITDNNLKQLRVVKEKELILDFLTGAENSGKAWFSTFYISPDGKQQHDVVINKIDSSKEGGDWETDIQEAVNIICFAMRVHSNLVGSVPGKAQSNNSGSDKRELYTIAQALQKPYHDILFNVHNLICNFNNWKGVHPYVPFIQLTTLDEHTSCKTVTTDDRPSFSNPEFH